MSCTRARVSKNERRASVFKKINPLISWFLSFLRNFYQGTTPDSKPKFLTLIAEASLVNGELYRSYLQWLMEFCWCSQVKVTKEF